MRECYDAGHLLKAGYFWSVPGARHCACPACGWLAAPFEPLEKIIPPAFTLASTSTYCPAPLFLYDG